MKTKLTQLSLVILTSVFLIGGCQTTGTQNVFTPAQARVAAAIACTGTLTFAVKPSDRQEVAAYIYAVAQGVRSLAGGTVPTPEQLRATVALFTHNSDAGQWTVLATGVQSIYSGLYAQLQGNPKLAAQYLEAIAQGCEDAASSFLPPKPSPTP